MAKLGVRLKSAKLAEPSLMAIWPIWMPRVFLGGRLGCAFRRAVGRLRDQQVIDVGGAVIVDHEARIGLHQVDLVDRQAVAVLIVQPFEHQLLPFHEIAGFQGVQGVQLVDLGAASHAECQGIDVFQVHRQVAAEHAAAQLQANERADVGLGDPQVDVLGLHRQLGGHRLQVDHAVGEDLALFAHSGVELEVERRLVEAVEVLHVDVQRADLQGHGRLGLTVRQVHLVIAQLHVLEQHLPGFARRRSGSRRSIGGGRSGLGSRFGRLAGEQFLPVQLAIGLQGGPGFQFLAADLADHHLLLGQVDRGLTDVQALQAGQWPTVRGLDGKRRDADRGIAEQQFGFLGQVQLVAGVEVQHAVFEDQGQGIADIGPPGFHLAVGDFQGAFGGDRSQAEIAAPIDLTARGARGDQGHVGTVIGQGAEVLQLEIEFVVEEIDGLAGPRVLEVHITARQLDAPDTQGERLGLGVVRSGFAGGQVEQAQQVELAVLGEQDLALGFVQLDIGQVQRAGPEAVQLQVGVETFEGHLLLPRLTDIQAPQRQFETERVEFDALDLCRYRRVVGQLLIGHSQGDARQNQKAQQAVQGESGQQGADSADQSFGHARLHLSESEVRWSMACVSGSETIP